LNRKKRLWITSLICLLPVIFSAVVYTSLPEQVAIHWNSAGVPDRYAHKAFAAFGLPILLIALNFLSQTAMMHDPKRAGHSKAMHGFACWLIPAISIIMVPVTLLISMGFEIDIVMVVTLMVGVLFVILGNYLPKCRQNYTMGIKLPWTLSDEENWNKTHRVAGLVWMVGGIVIIASNIFLQNMKSGIPVVLIVTAFLVLIPGVYSYLLYRKNTKE